MPGRACTGASVQRPALRAEYRIEVPTTAPRGFLALTVAVGSSEVIENRLMAETAAGDLLQPAPTVLVMMDDDVTAGVPGRPPAAPDPLPSAIVFRSADLLYLGS